MCGVCNKVFDDQAQLNNHMAQTHNLSCIVCHSSHFTNRQALMDHSKYCNMADLDEKSGPLNNADSSTMSLLLKALSESKADIPAHRLREIKSLELKQNEMKKTPELFLKKADTLMDSIVFEHGLKPGAVASV